MNTTDNLAFAALFKDAYLKCFGRALEDPLSESESKLFCIRVLDQTGFSIGWKSVKNYSLVVVGQGSAKEENSSLATLDTLARYVLRAPYTSENKRKDDESHYPYWFLYKEKFARSAKDQPGKRWLRGTLVFAMGIGMIILSILFIKYVSSKRAIEFSDNFNSVSDQSLQQNGWFLKNKDRAYWDKKAAAIGALSLHTLKGDNWPDPENQAGIKNLLLRKIPYDCFTAEVHLNDFIPKQEWQQAGILLLEDTTLKGKSIRLCIAYHDYFGGYPASEELLIQAINSLGNGFGKPEAIAHQSIICLDSLAHNPALIKNLDHLALRIEKTGKKFRLFYSGGPPGNTAFKEIASQEFDMQPRYIGIFASKGFKDSAATIPARFTFFRMTSNACGQ